MKLLLSTTLIALTATAALAHDPAIEQEGAVLSPAANDKVASFDILAAHAHAEGNTVTFHMRAAAGVARAIG